MDAVFELVGQAVAFGGGGVAIGFLLFKWLGQKWLENRFARQLSDLQHEQNKALAHLRVAIDTSLSGHLKIQEREFSVLPQLWVLLLQSYAAARSYTFPIEMVADVNRMNPEELEEHLGSLDWSESDKKAIRLAGQLKLDEVYSQIRSQYKVMAARRDWFAANLFIKEQAIVLPEELTAKFESLQELLWNLIGDRQVGVETKDRKLQHQVFLRFQETVEPLIKDAEVAIRKRLESHKSAGLVSVSS